MRLPGLWRAAGMGGQRLDRAELRTRMADTPDWIVSGLADAFEPAFLHGLKQVADRKKKKTPDRAPRRSRRQGRPDPSDDGGDT